MNTPARTLVFSAVMMISIIACRGSIMVTWLDEPMEVGGYWNSSTSQPIDIDGDGVTDFSFLGTYSFLGLYSETVNRYLITPSPPPNIGGAVSALHGGEEIGQHIGTNHLTWFGNDHDYWSTLMEEYDTGRSGEFWNTPDAWGPPWDSRSPPEMRTYIGIEFEINAAIHYGWIEVQGHWSYPSAFVWGWAYESTPGMPISAGAIPEPSTLSLLGLGVIALLYQKKAMANNQLHPTSRKMR